MMYFLFYYFLLLHCIIPFVSSILATDPTAQTRQAILGQYGASPYTSLAAGNGFTCAILMNGNVACWGRAENGRLARHSTESVGVATTVATKDNHLSFSKDSGVRADAVFAGDCYAGAIIKQIDQPTGPSEPGDLLMWGCCTFGVCGSGVNQNLGDSNDRPVYPTGLIRMPQNRKVLAVGAGPFHLCAILNATDTNPRQDVVCWGRNDNGNLGRGDTKNIGDAQSVEAAGKLVDLNNRNIVDVCAGIGHSCALDDQGIMNCWGLNTAGQLGIGSTAFVGRNTSNTNEYMPSNPLTYVDVGKDLYVTQIACGFYHTCALLSDSSVRCWGNSTFGQTGLGRNDLVATNRTTLPSLTGAIYLPPGSKAIAIFAGSDSSAALLDIPHTNHRLLVWGANHRGQLGLGHTNHIGDDEYPGNGGGSIPWYGNVDGRMPYHAAIGYQHICVILIWGQVTCHGANTNGELGLGNNVDIGDNERVSAGGIVALPTWMVQNYTNGILPDQISTCESFTCGILDGRTRVYCMGSNTQGVLGLGFRNTTGSAADQVIVQPGLYSGTSSPPFLNFGGLRIMRISVGPRYGCAIREDNKIFCWGVNVAGTLGCGRANDVVIGDDESPLECFVNIDVGRLPLSVHCSMSWNCLVLLDDGYVMGWGNNDHNMMTWNGGNPANTPVWIPKDRGKVMYISNGGDGACLVREVGGFYCTGPNFDQRWRRDPLIWVDNVGFVRQIGTTLRHTAIVAADRRIYVSGRGDNPSQGSLGLGNSESYGIDSMIHLPVNVGGTGIVLGMARSWHGTCYITSDYDVRCWGHPIVNAQSANVVIGDNEVPGSTAPLTFPSGFGRVIPTLSITYSSIPNLNLCMIGTNGQPACWGHGGQFRLGIKTEADCAYGVAISTCSLVNLGIGNSVGYYPPTMISIRPLPFPGDIPNGDPKGTVFEIEAKHIGLSRIEPNPLTVWFGDTNMGCNSLSRLSPSRLLCSLTEQSLQDIRQAIASTPNPNSMYSTITWGSSTAAQPVTNLGTLTTFTEPTVTDVIPNIISTTLQQRITIGGTGFGKGPEDKPRAWIGKYECTNALWISDTLMSCLTPLAVGSNLTITVTVQGNVYPSRSTKRLISYAKPNITSISPTTISSGGETLHIRGFGYGNDGTVAQLYGNYSVWLDTNVPCLAVTYVSDSYLRCTVPSGFAKRNVDVTVVIGGQNASSTDSGIYVSVDTPVLTRIIPSIVWTGDIQHTRDFTLIGSNFDTSSGSQLTLVVYGNICPTVTILNASTVSCTGLSVYNFSLREGVYMITKQGVRSNVYSNLLTVLPRARVVSITPPAARMNTPVLIEGVNLGYVPDMNISSIHLGTTPCSAWRYSTPGVSILCTVGEGRGNNVPITVRFMDGPDAAVVIGVTFSYITDLRLKVAWSTSTVTAANEEVTFLPLPSLPSNPLYLTPAPIVILTDDQGVTLSSNVVQSINCTLYIDEGKSLSDTKIYVNGNANSINARLFGNTTVTGLLSTDMSVSMAVFDTVGVTGTFGNPLLLQVTCGIPVIGPFFTTPMYLNTSIARIVPYFSSLPSTGEIIPSTAGTTNDNMRSIYPAPVISFRVYNGQRRSILGTSSVSTTNLWNTVPSIPLVLPRSVLPYISCSIDALSPTLSSTYLTQTALLTTSPYRLVGNVVQSLTMDNALGNVVVANFSKLGVLAPFGSPIVWGTTCAWLTQEPIRGIANTTVNVINISIVFNGTTGTSNLPRTVRYNAEFRLPNIVVRILPVNQSIDSTGNGKSSSTIPSFTSQDVDCTLSVKHTATNTPVPYFGGLPLPYYSSNGTLSFLPIALQPFLQVSKTNTDPLSINSDPSSSVQIPSPYTMTITPVCLILGQSIYGTSFPVTLQRLQVVWLSAPPIAFMPSSCGRSTNSSVYLGGVLDATTGTISKSGQAVIDALAPIGPSLPTITVGLQDYDNGNLADEETGGICSMTISNVTFATKTPLDQRQAALGGTTVVYTTNGKAEFRGITINSPLGSTVTLQVECSRAQGGGRSLLLSTPIAMMDSVINWLTAPSVTAKVLTNNQAINIAAIPVAHNRSTTLKIGLKIRQPIESPSWSKFTQINVRDFQAGIDPPTVCTLLLSQNGIVTTTTNSKVSVPLDTTTTKLYLRTAASSGGSAPVLADSTGMTTVSGWTVNGNNGEVALTFQLVAPLDTPVAVQAMCTIGQSLIYSDPIAIVASAAKLAFESSLYNIPYAIIPSLPDDPVKNFLRIPYISFGLLSTDSATFLVSSSNSIDFVPIGCKIEVVEGSVTLSPTSLLELSSWDANVVIEGADLAMVDPLTGVATFSNVLIYGPLGTRLTLRSACTRPYEETTAASNELASPVSKVDTSVIIADVEVVWFTAESVGIERTRLGSSIVFQADTTLRLVTKLNWLLPVAGKISSFVRMEMNESTLTPSLSISCSLRVPDRQVRTSSIYYEINDVPAFDDGSVAFQIRLQEPLAYPFTLYADCLLPTKQKRSTPPLIVTLVSPSPIPRRAAFTANPSLSSTSSSLPTDPLTSVATPTQTTTTNGNTVSTPTATSTASSSPLSGNTVDSPSASTSPTASPTPSSTRSVSGSIASVSVPSSVTASRTSTPSPTPSPSVYNDARIQFDMVIPSIPLTDIDALYTSIQEPSVLVEFSKGVLRMLQDLSNSDTSSPTSTRITTITNSHTGSMVYIPLSDSVYDASSLMEDTSTNNDDQPSQQRRRNLQSSTTGTLTLGISAAFHDTAVAQNILASIQTVFASGNTNPSSFNMTSYLGASFALLEQISGIPTSAFLSSCCTVNTTTIGLTILPSTVAQSNTTSTLAYFITYIENTSLLLIVAAVLGSLLVFVLTVWMYTMYRTRRMQTEEYRSKRLSKLNSTNVSPNSNSTLSKRLLDNNDTASTDSHTVTNAKQWEYTAQVLEDIQRAIQQQDATIQQQDATILALNNRLRAQEAKLDSNSIRTAWTIDQTRTPATQGTLPLPSSPVMAPLPQRIIDDPRTPPNRLVTNVAPIHPYYPGTIVEVSYGNGNSNTNRSGTTSTIQTTRQQELANIDNVLFNVPQY